jgi:DNA-binding HxlR family transcriptional regulator
MIDKICATWLQSGHAWHTSGDVVNLTGLDGRLARNTLAAMVRNGFAERRRIPGFKPARFTKEPRYLYRLTDRGRALGDLIRRLK